MKLLNYILLIPLNLVYLLIFAGYFLLLFPVYFVLIKIKKRWSHNTVQNLNKVWAYLMSTLLFSPVIVKGRGKVPGGVYIIVSNHSSYWDIGVCMMASPVQFRFLGKVEIVKAPLFGLMFREVHIPVNRGNRVEAVKSLNMAKLKLEQGVSVLIYAEGTIPDKKKVTLGPFKDGAFHLALETGIPILPMTIMGSNNVMPDEKPLFVRPFHRVKVQLDEPIITKGMNPESTQELKQQVYQKILSNLTGN